MDTQSGIDHEVFTQKVTVAFLCVVFAVLQAMLLMILL